METDRRRFGFRVLIGLAVGTALVYGIGWETVLRTLDRADFSTLILVPVGIVGGLLLGAEGIRVAFGFPIRGRRAWLVRRAFVGAVIIRALVPAGNVGSGGFVAYTVSRHSEIEVSEALAGVTAWECVMALASAIVGGAGLLVIASDGSASRLAVDALALLFLGICVLLLAGLGIHRYRGRVTARIVRIARTGEPILDRLGVEAPKLDRSTIRAGIDGFFEVIQDLLATPARTVTVLLTAHLVWLSFILPIFASLQAIGTPVRPAVAMVAVTGSGLARAIPVPTGVGPVDAALGGLIVVLTGYSLGDIAPALVLNRAGILLTQVSVGSLALWSLGDPTRHGRGVQSG